jgi:uncharacterized protein YdeI (BOF family)
MKTIRTFLTIFAMLGLSLFLIPNAYSDDGQQEINKISELEKYTVTHIKGEVKKILDEDTFRLEDSSGKIKVYTGWKNTNTVKVGETVTVKGKLDPGLIKEFYASEIIRENGEIVSLQSDE